MKWDTTMTYIAAVGAGLLYAFLIGCASLLYDLADDAGFNPFEILFFRGFVAFIGGIIYDASDKYMIENSRQKNNGNIISNLSSDNIDGPMSIDMSVSSSIPSHDQETRALISDETTKSSHGGGGVVPANDNSEDGTLWCPGSSLDVVYAVNLYNCKQNGFYDDKYEARIWITIRGFLRVPTVLFLYCSLSYIYLGTSIALQSTSAIWSLFFDKFMFDKTLTWDHYIGTILVVTGMVLVTQPSFIFSSDSADDSKTNSSLLTTLGYFSGIASAIFQAAAFAAMAKFSSIEKKRNVNDVSIIFAGMYSVSFHYTIFGIFGSFIIYDEFLYNNITTVGASGIFYVIGVGLFNLTALISVNYSVARLTVNEFSLLALTEIVWAYVFECLVLSEVGDWIEVLGVIVIVVSMGALFGYHIYIERMRMLQVQPHPTS